MARVNPAFHRRRLTGWPPSDARRAIDAVWRIESARLIAGLARMTGDVGVAEDLAQDALVAALEQWPRTGVPDNPGAWLMATAKNRAIDRAAPRRDGRAQAAGAGAGGGAASVADRGDLVDEAADDIGDDLLALIFTACHPVLATEARVALTLRLVGSLTTAEIARAFLVKESTVAQRIVRAKRTLAEARVPIEVPSGAELDERLDSVLEVIYAIFNEGYAASAGEELIRADLCEEAMRLGRILAGLAPREPEVHGLVALMELQASRFPARTGPSGEPVLLLDQDRGRWDFVLIGRGLTALERAEGLGPPARPLHAAGRDRRLPRAGAQRRGDRLGADRRPLRRPRRDHPLAGGRAEPRGRGGDGVRPGGGAGAARRAGRRAGAGGLPPAAGGARRPAGAARPRRGGARRVRARRRPHAE